MYVGNAHAATAEKGEKLLKFQSDALARLVRAIKADEVAPGLVAEFNQRQRRPNAPAFWTEEE